MAKNNQIITILFEEHWVSPLTQSVNYYGWQVSKNDPTFKTRLQNFVGVYYNFYLRFPFDKASWTARSLEINKMIIQAGLAKKNYYDFVKLGQQMNLLLAQMTRTKLIDQQFVINLKKLYLLGIESCRLGYIGVVADLPTGILSKKMKSIVESKIINSKIKKSVPEIVNLLSAPPDLSLSFIKERELLRLAKYISQNKIKNFKTDPKLINAIEKYYYNYYWTDFGHFGLKQSLAKVYQELRQIVKQKSLAKINRRIKEIENYARQTVQIKTKIIKQLKLNLEEKNIFAAAGLFSLIKAWRLEYLSGLNSQIARLVKFLSKKHKIKKELLYFTLFGELLKIYESGIKPGLVSTLKQRAKFCVLLTAANPFAGQLLVGSAAKDFYKKHIREEMNQGINDRENFHGSVAYPGKVRGRVKIIHNPKEMNKMALGDILVTTQTIPEMLPAMKKAAAFITDSGGITCHAAIIAREMKKPCIVGTKIATKILVDGDVVEVDAFKGLINIIKIN